MMESSLGIIKRFNVDISILIGYGFLLLIPATLVFVIGGAFFRSRSIIKEWTRENRLELVKQDHPLLRQGPFWGTTSRVQDVYRIIVRDEQGNTRSGWARVGSWWRGLFEREVEVRWDDVPRDKRKEKLKNG